MKKISIAMAVYNAEKYIYQTLCAIQSQTFEDFECIIVDDHSTDETVNVIYNMVCAKDDRFKLYLNCTDRNSPYIDAHNLSYSLCTGEYIVRLDDDDIPNPNMLETYVKFMDEHSEYDACCATLFPMWSNSVTGFLETPESSNEVTGEIKRKWFYIFPTEEETDQFNLNPAMDHLDHPLNWCNQCSCIRKEFLTSHDLKFKYYGYGDYLFWVEFFAEGGKAYKLKDILLKYRVYGESASHDRKWQGVSNYFERDLAVAKVKIVKLQNNPAYNKHQRIFENTVRYFNNLIEREKLKEQSCQK